MVNFGDDARTYCIENLVPRFQGFDWLRTVGSINLCSSNKANQPLAHVSYLIFFEIVGTDGVFGFQDVASQFREQHLGSFVKRFHVSPHAHFQTSQIGG